MSHKWQNNEISHEKIIQLIMLHFKGQKVISLLKKSLNTYPTQNLLQSIMSNLEGREG